LVSILLLATKFTSFISRRIYVHKRYYIFIDSRESNACCYF
jgi:hypothetical protein